MPACSVSQIANVPPAIAEALESLRAAWERAVQEARTSGQRVRDCFGLAMRRSDALRAAMNKHGLILETSARMLRALKIPAAQVEALLPGEERQPVLWLLSSAVVLLCARDERVMMLEPPFVLLGVEPPARAHTRSSAPKPTALELFSWVDAVWPGFVDRKGLDLSGPVQAPEVLMGHVAEAAAERLKAGDTESLQALWPELESVASRRTWDLTPLYDRMCWRAKYQRFDLGLFRQHLGPVMTSQLVAFQNQRAEEEERAIRDGSHGY